MKNKKIKVFALMSLTVFTSCSQNCKTETPKPTVNNEPHRYGGWYCPDNLNGFPAVNIKDWKDVPVVNGRMPTKEETQNGTSLIFVDQEKYPNAKPLTISLPQLATIQNEYTNREDIIIIIQALNIANDSIVGFRYLNGGNGSARLNKVTFLSEDEIDKIPTSEFVTHSIEIDATQDQIWKVLTLPENAKTLEPIFNVEKQLPSNWRTKTNVNYHYSSSGKLTSSYADQLFGNYYIQNDYNQMHYNEKFLLLEDQETKKTELRVVSGPFVDNYEKQKDILSKWAQKVKVLSEKK